MSSAKLISFSKSVDNENDSIIDMVADVARVSNPANQNNKLTNEKLINYLIKNKHWSPFEMVSICIEIKTSRDIARQILRHRSFSFQEFSQRYAKVSEDFYEKEARMQDSKNRQSSLMTDNDKLKKEWEEKQDEIKTLLRKIIVGRWKMELLKNVLELFFPKV